MGTLEELHLVAKRWFSLVFMLILLLQSPIFWYDCQAGANSVGHLLTSSLTGINLHGAILQSGGPGSPLLTLTMEEAESRTGPLTETFIFLCNTGGLVELESHHYDDDAHRRAA